MSLPSGFAPSHIPVTTFAVRLGVGAGALATAGLKVMLVACQTSAGTATAGIPVEVGDETDANAKFGARSRLAGACRAFRQIAPLARLYACPVADPGGTAATAVLTFAGPATAAGVVRMRVAGQLVREVQIPSGTTFTQAAAAVKAALDQMSDLPATGALSGDDSEVLTLTAAQTGAAGNQLRVQFEITAPGVTIALNGAAAATSGKAYFGSASPATAGSGQPTLTTALTAISGARYDRIGIDADDDTLRTTVSTHVDTQSGINVGNRRMASMLALSDTVSTAQADAVAIGTNPRVQLLHQKRPHNPGNEILGAYLAAKIYGPQDGRLPGEDSYRAAKANGLSLYPAILATDEEERLSAADVTSLLASGVTSIGVDGAHPGYAAVVRPVTCRTLNAQGGTSYAVHDTAKVVVPDFLADRLEAFAAENYADKNLVDNPASTEEAPTNPYLIWPSAIRDDVLSILRQMEEEGLVVRVTELAGAVTVTKITVDGTTYAVASIPAAVVDHFHSFVGDVRQVG